MKKKQKYLFIVLVIITIIIAILASFFITISAAFYRGSLISNIESENLTEEEISKLENEVSITGILATAHIVLTAAIIACFIIFIILLIKKFDPKKTIYIGAAIACFSIAQIFTMKDQVVFLVMSLPALTAGLVMIVTGFIKQRHLRSC